MRARGEGFTGRHTREKRGGRFLIGRRPRGGVYSYPPFLPSTRQRHGKMGKFSMVIRQKSVREPSGIRQENWGEAERAFPKTSGAFEAGARNDAKNAKMKENESGHRQEPGPLRKTAATFLQRG